MTASLRTRFMKTTAVGSSLTLAAGLLVAGVVAASPAAAATFTVGEGVEALGIIATGANGGSSEDGTDWPIGNNNPGGTGAVVTSVLSSGFASGDVINTTIGTGGDGAPAFGKAGGGGGGTFVTNTTSATDLVIAGGGGGAATTGSGGNAGALASGDGSAGGSGIPRNGKGGAGGVGGAAGTGNVGVGHSGGVVNGGNGMDDFYGDPNTQGGLGAVGSTGGAVGYGPSGGGGGAGFGGGGGGGHQTGGEGGGGAGGGGGGGSFSLSSSRTFEQAEVTPGIGQPGTDGSAVVTWISQSTVNAVLGSNPGEIDISWDTPGFSTASSQLGTITYELYRDGSLVETTQGTSFTDSPGAGTHDYQLVSLASLNSKADNEVGELKTASEEVTSPAVVSAPTVTSVAPSSGPTSGGTDVTITGTEFLPGASVKFGGVACVPVVVVSTTKITCKTGAHAAGAVSVVVTNTDAASASLADAFTYTGGGSVVKKPNKPRNVSVSGTAKSSKRVVRWKAPANTNGERPVTYYRIKLNRVRCSNLIVNKRLSKKATSYTFKRSLLLKNLSCRTQRGEVKPKQGVFRVRIEAFNATGGGPVAVTRLIVRR